MNISSLLRNKLFYLLIGLVPIIIFAVLLISVAYSPYLGMEFERKNDKWYVVSIDNAIYLHEYDNLLGAEVIEIAEKKIEADDLVQYIDDRKDKEKIVSVFAPVKYFSENIQVGKKLHLKFLKENKEVSIYIIPSSYQILTFLIKNSLILLIAISFYLIGLIVTFKKHSDKKILIFFALCMMHTLTSISLAFYYRDIGYSFAVYLLQCAVYYISVYYFAVFALSFFLFFPAELDLVKKNPSIIGFVGIAPIVGFALWPITGTHIYHYWYFIVLGVATSMVMLYRYFTIESPDIKAQIKMIVVAVFMAYTVVLFLYLMPMVLLGHALISFILVDLVVIVFPLSMAFAIMRYKLMDIDTLFDNTIIYTVTILVLASLDLLIIYLLTGTVLAGLNIPLPLVVVLAVWIIIFAYIPIRNFVQNTIKKLLKRELYNIDQVALSLSRQMLSAGDMAAAFEKATGIITDTLHPKGIEYIFMGEKGSVLMEDKPVVEPRHVSSFVKPVSLFEIEFSDKALPDNYSGGALVPVVGTKGHLGYFILQDKHSQRLYDSEDMKLLSIIASQLALTLEAIQYKEELRKNEAESQKEKDRLIKDIHDGLGGTLSSINILSQKGSHSDYPAEVKGLFSTLSDLSKESLFEMRNLYNIIEKKEIEWDVVITEMKNFGVFMLEPHKITLNFRDNISSDAPPSLDNLDFVNIYKIYKEAVSNTVKYSHATKVDVAIVVQKNSLILSIQDNGIGLRENLPTPESGRGLKNMQDRAAEIGARLKIASENGVLIYFEKVW